MSAGVDPPEVEDANGEGDASDSEDSSSGGSGLDASVGTGSALSEVVGNSVTVVCRSSPRRTEGVALALGESSTDGDADELWEALAETLVDGDAVGDVDALTVGDGEGLPDGLGEIEGAAEIDGLGVADLLGEGDEVDATLRGLLTAATSHSGGSSSIVGSTSDSSTAVEGAGRSAACATGRDIVDRESPSAVTATTAVRMANSPYEASDSKPETSDFP